MYVLKTQEYIPYYGVINLDAEDNVEQNQEVEFQNFNDVESLNFDVSSHRYQ